MWMRSPNLSAAGDDVGTTWVRRGQQLTVFTWGGAVERVKAAVSRTDVDAGILEVTRLAPLPRDALTEAAKDTGRLVIVHDGPRDFGIGAELAATFADETILHLDAPVVRVAGKPKPYPARTESVAAASVDAIAEALIEIADY